MNKLKRKFKGHLKISPRAVAAGYLGMLYVLLLIFFTEVAIDLAIVAGGFLFIFSIFMAILFLMEP